MQQPHLYGHSDGAPASFEQQLLPDGAVLRVRGEIDLTTADAFRKAVEAATGSARRLVIELSDCRYMDSTGLQVVARAFKHHPSLAVVLPQGPVRRLFDITGLTGQLHVRDSLEDAFSKDGA